LLIESFLCELELDVILDAFPHLGDDVFEVFTFFLIQLGLPLGERIAFHRR
jgi:hypothetical protein